MFTMCEQVDLPSDFNHSRLICLPKKPIGTRPDLGEFYACEATRPLSIVNTDNRLLGVAAKIIIHDPLEKLISPAQKGFLRLPQGPISE